MTESEWQNAAAPRAMLEFLRDGGRFSGRKARLFAAACCRRIWPLLTDARSRNAVEVAERFADGQASRAELKASREGALDATVSAANATAAWAAQRACAWRMVEVVWGTPGGSVHEGAPGAAADVLSEAAYRRAWEAGEDAAAAQRTALAGERRQQAVFLCDLFGPLPFRPVGVAPAVLQWRDGTAARLAQAAYDARRLPAGTLEPERLAVLADALEEAGCADADIVGHLRGLGAVHVRGCWVIDSLTGRG
jgi:hypothetical protein